MNMNPFPDWTRPHTQRTPKRAPLARSARWLAAALIIGGLALLEAHDAATERAIAAADARAEVVAQARPQ